MGKCGFSSGVKLPTMLALVLLVGGCANARPPPWTTTSPAPQGASAVTVRFTAGDEPAAAQVRRALRVAVPMAERWGALVAPVTITIHPTHEALEAAARRPGRAWLRAWARRTTIELQSPRTWSRGMATDTALVQLLAHELTHCALYAALGGDARRARSVPAWFWEGMATTTAGERFVSVGDDVTPDHPRHPRNALHATDSASMYPAADQAFRHLEWRYGQERIRRLLTAVRGGTEFGAAFRETFGVEIQAFEHEAMSTFVIARSHG